MEGVWGKNKNSKIMSSKIFLVKQKSIQFSNHGMSEFTYHETSMGKHRQFPGSAVPHKFRVSGKYASPNIWEYPNSHIIKVFCGKSYHSQDVFLSNIVHINVYLFHMHFSLDMVRLWLDF